MRVGRIEKEIINVRVYGIMRNRMKIAFCCCSLQFNGATNSPRNRVGTKAPRRMCAVRRVHFSFSGFACATSCICSNTSTLRTDSIHHADTRSGQSSDRLRTHAHTAHTHSFDHLKPQEFVLVINGSASDSNGFATSIYSLLTIPFFV